MKNTNTNTISIFALLIIMCAYSCSNNDEDNSISLIAQDISVTIDENPNSGQLIDTVQTNSTGTPSFSITTQSPTGALTIDPNTGVLTIADTTLFDFETNPTITADISIDDAGSIITSTASINLIDLTEIGEFKHGGIVFWTNTTNDEFYICSMNDQSTASEWDCNWTDVIGAYGSSFGDGKSNTDAIEAACSTVGGATDITANLNTNGYDDWFLPSYGEWEVMYTNKSIINTALTANGGSIITDDKYWASTTASVIRSRVFRFWDGGSENDHKTDQHKVRAIRSFTE